MCIYIYTYIYIYNIYIYLNLYMYVFIYIYRYLYLYISISLSIYAYMYIYEVVSNTASFATRPFVAALSPCRTLLHAPRPCSTVSRPLKVLCAPKWNDFEFYVIKTTKLLVEITQVPEKSELNQRVNPSPSPVFIRGPPGLRLAGDPPTGIHRATIRRFRVEVFERSRSKSSPLEKTRSTLANPVELSWG